MGDTYLPSFLVGYQLTLEAFAKAGQLEIERTLLPHYGVVEQERAKLCLKKAEAATRETAQVIVQMFHDGKTEKEILEFLEGRDYKDHVRPVYPAEAYRVNTRIMIELAIKELASKGQEKPQEKN